MNITYLEQEVLNKLSRIQFASKIRFSNPKKGFHKSINRGKSTEFKEHREYTFGDELKDIDWKVYGRTERFFVRNFEEEEGANIVIMLDTSSSMTTTFANSTPKIEYAKYIVSALSYLFLKQKDTISVATFDSKFNLLLKPTTKKNSLDILLDKFKSTKQTKTNTNFILLEEANALYKNSKFICIIISDMIAEKETMVSSISKLYSTGNEVSVIHMVHNIENDFDLSGYVEMIDPETNKVITTKASDIKQKFLELYHNYITTLQNELIKRNIDYNKFLMSKHNSDNLIDYLRKHRS